MAPTQGVAPRGECIGPLLWEMKVKRRLSPGQGQRKSQPFTGAQGPGPGLCLSEVVQGRDPAPGPQPPPRPALSQLLVLSLRSLEDKFSYIQVGSRTSSLPRAPDGGGEGALSSSLLLSRDALSKSLVWRLGPQPCLPPYWLCGVRKSLNLSEPWCPHLRNGHDKGTHLIEPLER